MIGFSTVFILANFGHTLSNDGVAPGWPETVLIGTVIGILYATLWPLACAVYHK